MSKCGFTKFRNLLVSPIVGYVLLIHVFCLVIFFCLTHWFCHLHVENKAEDLCPGCGCSLLPQYLPLAIILQNFVSDMSQKLSREFRVISYRPGVTFHKKSNTNFMNCLGIRRPFT